MLSGLAPGTTIAEMKSDVLSALKADVSLDALDFMAMDPPQISVESEDDFELCRAIKERGQPTGVFEILEPSKLLKDNGLTGWEAIFLQMRDRSSGKHILYCHPWCYCFRKTAAYSFTYFFHLCEYRVEVQVGFSEPHALNLQAIFYQSHTLSHQFMMKMTYRKQVIPQAL